MGEPGLDGTQVMVRHYDAEGEPLASSEPARIAIFDHGLSGFHHVTIHGADPSYGAGERVSLSAKVTVPNPLITRPTVLETYQWFVKRPGDAEPRPIEGATTADYTFGIEREWDGAELTSAVVHADGRIVYGPSDPVTLAVDRRAPHAPATPSVTHDGTTVTVTWDEPHDGGATVTGYDVILTAADGSRLTRSVGPDARSASFTDVPPGEWSAVVRATNELGVGPDSAASTPANLQAPGPPPEPQPEPRPDPGTPPAPTPVPTPVPETAAGPTATTLTATRATQTYGRTARLAVTVSPGATGTVSVRIPGRKQPVTGRVSNGRATLTLPRRALKPGTRTLTVRYAGVPGRFAASSARATVRVAKAKPRIRIQRVGSNGFRVRVTGSGVKPTGRVTVTVDGRRRTARLGAQGRTTVRLAATRSTRTRTTVSVSYAGDRYVARGTARATVTARR